MIEKMKLAVPIVFLDDPDTTVTEIFIGSKCTSGTVIEISCSEPQVTCKNSNKHEIMAHLLPLENSLFSSTT